MKYDFDLALNENDSLAQIIKRMSKNKKVLEFGCANGRLTKYLSENMKCDVTIVEIEEIAGLCAKPYAVEALLGEHFGNIENFVWVEQLRGNKYDYIIFADVLEHLRNAEKVLNECKNFLAENGSILASIPNIANGSILMNLIQDEFEYQNIGLLDNTHVKFYTYHTFHRMLKRLGYEICFETGTYTRIGEDEFQLEYAKIPSSLKRLLVSREFGHVYQFIFQFTCTKKNRDDTVISKFTNILDLYYQAVMYYLNNDIADELNTTRYKVILGKNHVTLNIQKSLKLRFDPINASAIIKNIEIKDERGCKIQITGHNAEFLDSNIYYFANSDPYFLFLIKEENIGAISITFELIDFEISEIAKELILSYCHQLFPLKENYTNCLETNKIQQDMLMKNNNDIIELNRIADVLNNEIENLRNAVKERDINIAEMNKGKIALYTENHELNERIIELDIENKGLNERINNYNKKKYNIKKI